MLFFFFLSRTYWCLGGHRQVDPRIVPENPGIVLMFTPPLRPEAPAGNNTCDMYVIVVVSNSIRNSG